MNNKRFLQILVVILMVSILATTYAARAARSSQGSFPSSPTGSDSLERVALAAGASGGISGTVSDGTKPIAGIEVTLYNYFVREAGIGWIVFGSTTTDTSGNYAMSGLYPEIYRARFYDNSGVYATEYYNNAFDLDHATNIGVTNGVNTSGIDVALVRAGHITGNVSNGTNPLQDIGVRIYYWSGSDYDWLRGTHTDASGNYDVSGLLGGTYRIRFLAEDGIHLSEYYDDAPDLESAADISVSAGVTAAGIDAILADGGHITGSVTDGTNPLQDVEVEVYYWTGSDYERLFGRYTYTDASGNYDVGALSTGTYRVRFITYATVFLSEYYDDAPDLDSATDISVTAGSTTSGIDAILAEEGHIIGTITNGTIPLDHIEVQAYYWTGSDYDESKRTFTDTSGNFDLSGLSSGTYRMRFQDYSAAYQTEYFNDAPDLNSAADISVTAGSTISGIDAELAERGHITGTVTDGAIPLEKITIVAYQWTGSEYVSSNFTRTDASGNYYLGGLANGTYWVGFHDNIGVYPTQYFDDAPDLDSANDINVTAGLTTAGIDAVLDAPDNFSYLPSILR